MVKPLWVVKLESPGGSSSTSLSVSLSSSDIDSPVTGKRKLDEETSPTRNKKVCGSSSNCDRSLQNIQAASSCSLVKQEINLSDRTLTADDLSPLSKQTIKNTKTAKHLMDDFCQQRDVTGWDTLPADQLDNLLSQFFEKICKKDGSAYKSSSLSSFRYGLSRHLQTLRPINIITDEEFRSSSDVYKRMYKEKLLVEAKPRPRLQIALTDIDKFYTAVDLNTPQGLQDKVLFDILFYFAPVSRDQLRYMTEEEFEFINDPHHGICICENPKKTNRNDACDSKKRYLRATGGPHCPVLSFQKYVSKLNKETNILWQQPLRRSCKDWSICQVWYQSKPLGKNLLGGFMTKLSTKYMLSQIYTNYFCTNEHQADLSHLLRQLHVQNATTEGTSSVQSTIDTAAGPSQTHTTRPAPQLPAPVYLHQSSGGPPLACTVALADLTKVPKVYLSPTAQPTPPLPGTGVPMMPGAGVPVIIHNICHDSVPAGSKARKSVSATSNCSWVSSLRDNPLIMDLSPRSSIRTPSSGVHGVQDVKLPAPRSSKSLSHQHSPEQTRVDTKTGDMNDLSYPLALVTHNRNRCGDVTESSSPQLPSAVHHAVYTDSPPLPSVSCQGVRVNHPTVHHTVYTDSPLQSSDTACQGVGVKMDEAIEVYRELAKFPTVKGGSISNKQTPGHIQVTSEWSQRDLSRKENVSFTKSYMVQLDVVASTTPQELSKVQWSVESPSGKLKAVVRKVTQKEGEDKQYVEIWNDCQKVHNLSVDLLDQHGKIYTDDSVFGCLAWSHSETHLLYVAEKKQPKGKYYFEQKAASSDDKDVTEGLGDEFLYKDDWGEQLTGKCHSVVCVLDVDAGAVSVLENIPDDVSAGHAVWCPDDLGIVCVGTYHGPYRLGRIYCPMRRSALFYVDLKTYKCEVLGSTEHSVDCPTFSPDNTKLVFLENNASGPHCQCRKLRMCDWSTKGIITIKDNVRNITSVADFPGVFSLTLRRRCWSSDSKRIVLDTQWRSKQELVVINCETGDVTRLTNDNDIGSWRLLDVHKDTVLAYRCSPDRPHHLVLGQLPALGKESSITWTCLDEGPSSKAGVAWSIHPVPVPKERVNPDYAGLDFEYIVMEPSQRDSKTKLPLVVFPHGGPHSGFVAELMLYPAGLCRLGFIVVCVNYRGSSGFGQDSIESLPGHVGTQDVQDVQAVAELALSVHNADPDKVVVMGGSHGGFLVTHLIGQYPDFYKAAMGRNPVINLASKTGPNDIPDWTYVEAGLPGYSHAKTGDPEMYTKAWQMSPIRHVDKVKAPVLLCVGLDDRRVPPKQANEYRRALQARGVEVRMLCYPDNGHPIIKVDSEADCFINMIKWFREHLDE